MVAPSAFKLMLPPVLPVGAAMAAGAPWEPPKKLPPEPVPDPVPAPPVVPVDAPGAAAVWACATDKLALMHSAANRWRANNLGKKEMGNLMMDMAKKNDQAARAGVERGALSSL